MHSLKPIENKFFAFSRNEHSQFGEDGIIEAILDCIPTKDKWCVEFGAWDGLHLSNTYSLIKNKGYKSVLIEADGDKFKELSKNLEKFNAILVNKFVTFDGENTLDNILSKTAIPKDFDLLSIDIDGNDFHIFESLSLYKPKIICIECNPTIPNEVAYVQPRDFSVKHGSSARSIYELALKKGYLLAASTMCNLILVEQAYWALLGLTTSSLDRIRDDSSARVFMFSGYDGSVLLSKPLDLLWHGFSADESWFQVLPKCLRRFSSDYSFVQRVSFAIFTLIKNPTIFFARIRAKLGSKRIVGDSTHIIRK